MSKLCEGNSVSHLKVGSDGGQRGFGNEAQVSRSRCRGFGFGLKLLPSLMQVEFLLSETQSFTVALKWQDYLDSAATVWYYLQWAFVSSDILP